MDCRTDVDRSQHLSYWKCLVALCISADRVWPWATEQTWTAGNTLKTFGSFVCRCRIGFVPVCLCFYWKKRVAHAYDFVSSKLLEYWCDHIQRVFQQVLCKVVLLVDCLVWLPQLTECLLFLPLPGWCTGRHTAQWFVAAVQKVKGSVVGCMCAWSEW